MSRIAWNKVLRYPSTFAFCASLALSWHKRLLEEHGLADDTHWLRQHPVQCPLTLAHGSMPLVLFLYEGTLSLDHLCSPIQRPTAQIRVRVDRRTRPSSDTSLGCVLLFAPRSQAGVILGCTPSQAFVKEEEDEDNKDDQCYGILSLGMCLHDKHTGSDVMEQGIVKAPSKKRPPPSSSKVEDNQQCPSLRGVNVESPPLSYHLPCPLPPPSRSHLQTVQQRLHLFQMWIEARQQSRPGSFHWEALRSSSSSSSFSDAAPWSWQPSADLRSFLYLSTPDAIQGDLFSFQILRHVLTSAARDAWIQLETELFHWRVATLPATRGREEWKGQVRLWLDGWVPQWAYTDQPLLNAQREALLGWTPDMEIWVGPWEIMDAWFRLGSLTFSIRWIPLPQFQVCVHADDLWTLLQRHWIAFVGRQQQSTIDDDQTSWWREHLHDLVSTWSLSAWAQTFDAVTVPRTPSTTLTTTRATPRSFSSSYVADNETFDSPPLDLHHSRWHEYLPPCLRYIREVYTNPSSSPDDMHMHHQSRWTFLSVFHFLGYKEWDTVEGMLEGPVLTSNHSTKMKTELHAKPYNRQCKTITLNDPQNLERRRWCPFTHEESAEQKGGLSDIESLGQFLPVHDKCRQHLEREFRTHFHPFYHPRAIGQQLATLFHSNARISLQFEQQEEEELWILQNSEQELGYL